jgi:hypothetical protein
MAQIPVEDTITDFPRPSRRKWFIIVRHGEAEMLAGLNPVLWVKHDMAVAMPLAFSCVPRAARIVNMIGEGNVKGVPYEQFQLPLNL